MRDFARVVHLSGANGLNVHAPDRRQFLLYEKIAKQRPKTAAPLPRLKTLFALSRKRRFQLGTPGTTELLKNLRSQVARVSWDESF